MKGFKMLNKKNLLTGFTLIEMMIVIIIIGVLAGLITTAVFKSIQDAKKSQAEASIAALEMALAMYKSDVGEYPPHFTAGGIFSISSCHFVSFLEEGKTNPGSTDIIGWNGPYMQFKDEEVSGSLSLDPWKVPYQYRNPGTNNPASYFDLWSKGPDAGEDSDDITNW